MVIDAAPKGGKDLAIRLFNTNDKLALQVGTVVLLVVIGAAIGLLARRWRWVPYAGFGVLGVLAIVAALTRAGASAAWLLPGLIAAVVGAGLLVWLLRQLDAAAADYATAYGTGAERQPTGGAPAGGPAAAPTGGYADGPSRRRFLWGSLLAIGGGLAGRPP
jgi:hypothetical protein